MGRKRGNSISVVFFVLTGIAIVLPVFFNFELSFSVGNQVLRIIICYILSAG